MGRACPLPVSPEPMTRFGIVIPAYRQPQFLVESVSSAAEQSLARESATLIVNDGCPLVETHQLGTLLASTYPTVHYVQRENGGPGAARNFGVRFLLERLPELESFFFLDADNYAQPTVLERLARTLDDSGADWAYADLTLFGSSG